ncbi:hypothetical protein [Paenibacillus soyae]|uniref:Uncharacterized protein n=1 Tax=Paenibacillus soyae TaxID=2969249 RepID=A0A9X2S771_9BACL|nr:hypothetical protein [Paenibacillus soyae]MCR2802745.1 hypothetical protein [Paenibacillus soyae]
MAEHEYETNILAFFHRPDQADQAMKKLDPQNVVASSINTIDGYPGDGNVETSNPLTGNFPGLGYLTLGGDFEHNASVLAAASVSASGLSSGGPDNRVTGRNILLTVIVKDEYAEEAARILEDEGALI